MTIHHNTAKKYARNLIKAFMAVAQHHIENDELIVEVGLTDMDDSEVESSLTGMAAILAKYRSGYEKAVSYTNGVTLDNGDQLAIALRGKSPAEVCLVADLVYNDMPGTHWARYEHLNVGQKRMSAGNRIRGAIRKELVTLEQVLAWTGNTKA